MRQDNFDLSEFLTDSLSLQAQGPARHTYKVEDVDPYLELLSQDPLEIVGEKFIITKEKEESSVGSPIQEFFRDREVFITGGTGFLGKILIDKLIRSVPDIVHIYVLVRGKKGKSSKDRFENLLADQVFLRMKTEVPEYAGKISFVEGDITLPGLGLSVTDRQMLIDKVNIIFNSAADVRFIEPLRSSLTSNVLGSRSVLDLAKELKDLKCFLHVSTAYSQCMRRKVPEEVPRLPVYNYNEVIQIIDSKTDEELETEMWRIMQGWPNTYTFTKAVCEEMLVEEGKDLPLCIFRPAVVGQTYKEPVRGWTDNLYGPIGLFVGSKLGVVHCFPLQKDLYCEFVPVDYVVNCLIAAAWRSHQLRHESSLSVYNYSASPEHLHTWKKAVGVGLKYRDHFPSNMAIYYPSYILTSSKLVDGMVHIFLHKIPGRIIDLLSQLLGKKPRLTKIYDRINILKGPLEWFGSRTWEFEKENVTALARAMSEEDKRIFGFDIVDVDLTRHLLLSSIGVRYFFFKEKMESIPAARVKNECLRWIHITVKTSCCILALKILSLIAHALPI